MALHLAPDAFFCRHSPLEPAHPRDYQEVESSPKSRSPGKRMESVLFEDRDLQTSSGHAILRAIPEGFKARQQTDLASGIVLELSAAEKSSRIDTGLGILQCNRYITKSGSMLWCLPLSKIFPCVP